MSFRGHNVNPPTAYVRVALDSHGCSIRAPTSMAARDPLRLPQRAGRWIASGGDAPVHATLTGASDLLLGRARGRSEGEQPLQGSPEVVQLAEVALQVPGARAHDPGVLVALVVVGQVRTGDRAAGADPHTST